jgi:hypothetical protein
MAVFSGSAHRGLWAGSPTTAWKSRWAVTAGTATFAEAMRRIHHGESVGALFDT